MTNVTNKMIKENVITLKIEELVADPNQARKYFDPVAHSEMVQSITKYGVINPIIVTRISDEWKIVAGERRYRAAREAGLEEVHVRCIDSEATAISIIENLQRENLLPMEKAEGLQRLKNEHQYTHEQLAQIIGKSVPTVSEILALNRLPDDIKSECCSNKKYVHSKLLEIAKAPNTKSMRKRFEAYKRELDGTKHITTQIGKQNYLEGMISRISGMITQINAINPNLMNSIDLNRYFKKLDELVCVAYKNISEYEMLSGSDFRSCEDRASDIIASDLIPVVFNHDDATDKTDESVEKLPESPTSTHQDNEIEEEWE